MYYRIFNSNPGLYQSHPAATFPQFWESKMSGSIIKPPREASQPPVEKRYIRPWYHVEPCSWHMRVRQHRGDSAANDGLIYSHDEINNWQQDYTFWYLGRASWTPECQAKTSLSVWDIMGPTVLETKHPTIRTRQLFLGRLNREGNSILSPTQREDKILLKQVSIRDLQYACVNI